MSEEDYLRERARLEVQLLDYWHDVDTNWGRNAASYYTEDALFDGDATTYRGRDEIAAFYAYRLERGERVAVHSVSNFRVAFEDPAEVANATWYLLAYAADGSPVLPTHPPIVIALVRDRYARQQAGTWLCAHRRFEVLFAGGTKPTNPKLDKAGG